MSRFNDQPDLHHQLRDIDYSLQELSFHQEKMIHIEHRQLVEIPMSAGIMLYDKRHQRKELFANEKLLERSSDFNKTHVDASIYLEGR